MRASPRRKSLVEILAVAICSVATTCHAPVGFEITGDVASGVRIGVADLVRDGDQVSVRTFTVGQADGGVMWRLEGEARVRSVVYGEAPEGLKATMGPSPLEPGRAFYVVVTGDSRWGRDAKGTCRFLIEESGAVYTEPGC